MKVVLSLKEGMLFDVESGEHRIQADAKPPIGKGLAMTPKDMVLAGLGGCTAMDVAALLRKHKQPLESLSVAVSAKPSEGKSPVVFQSAEIQFNVAGNIDKNILLESVRLSQTKYCGVSAMLSKAFPIHYSVRLNGEAIGDGRAEFGNLE